MNQPIIGITLDQENKKTYSNFPWYAARKNYAECVTLCSGVPIFLPHVESGIDKYLEIINGLIITGGDFDVNPNLYGEKDINPNVTLKPDRTNFEFKITEKAMKRKTGARGLRTLIESLLLDTMYDLPSHDDIIKVVIDKNVVDAESKPLLIYKSKLDNKEVSKS